MRERIVETQPSGNVLKPTQYTIVKQYVIALCLAAIYKRERERDVGGRWWTDPPRRADFEL